ncbi:MAG: hypothetical protein KGI24_07250, partial [Candidatus Omnitrophica bacterium]|nr:hypothetical protein [Candidatus Omnitrophota bacterium]
KSLSNYAKTSVQPIYAFADARAYQVGYFRNSDLIKIFNFFYDDVTIEKELFLKRKYQAFFSCFDYNGERLGNIISKEKGSLNLVIAFLKRHLTLIKELSLKERTQDRLKGMENLLNTKGKQWAKELTSCVKP